MLILKCEGYEMFYGTMIVSPKNTPSFEITGTWLYRQDTKCWYCGGRSFSPRYLTCKEVLR